MNQIQSFQYLSEIKNCLGILTDQLYTMSNYSEV